MSVQQTITIAWASANGANPVTQSVALTANGEDNRNFTVPNGTTQIGLAWTNANLKLIYILSDQDLTLKTNSSGSPQDTITIKANQPFAWYYGSGVTNPFAGNVTTTYWVNAGGTTANVQVQTLSNT